MTRTIRRTLVLTLAALAAQPALAQGLLKTNRLSASLANEAVAAAVDACAKQGFAVTAVLLDTSGAQQALLRGDGAGIHTLATTNDKAYTAVTFKVDTIALVERAKTGPVSSAIAKVPHLLLAQGGVVIKAGEDVIGAIGVGGAPGSDHDTRCARAGIEKISDRMK